MKKRDVVKLVSEYTVSAGVGLIVSYTVASVVPKDISRMRKTLISVGTMAIAGAVSMATASYVNSIIDGVSDGIIQGKQKAAAKAAMKSYTVPSDEDIQTMKDYATNDVEETLNVFKNEGETDGN